MTTDELQSILARLDKAAETVRECREILANRKRDKEGTTIPEIEAWKQKQKEKE